MSARVAPLRQRMMVVFALFTLLVAGLFGLYSLAFMYAVEDVFLESALDREAGALQRAHAATGRWGMPTEAYMRLYPSPEAFPADLRAQHRDEPLRHEFAGQEGRHYHVRPLRDGSHPPTAWLVAEVSGQLVVRPMRGGILALLLATALALVVMALAVAAALAKRMADPLARLATAVEGMDAAHLPVHLAQGYRNDEVGVLARSLEALSARLREFVEREREFTRDVSHELRTPLTVIRSASEQLLARTDLDAAIRAHAQHLQQSSLQLQHTVDLLLSLAREAPPPADFTALRVLPLLERVIVDLAPLGEGRTLRFDIDVPPDASTRIPEAVLRSLLSNLVGNAMAHGADGWVGIHLRDRALHIENALSPELPPAAEGQRREGSPGLGLGLGIVRRLCERHGIALQVSGEGNRVVARIPL